MRVEAAFTIHADTIETNSVSGVEHTRIVGSIVNDQGETSDQVINVLSGNPRTNNNLHLIVGDNYPTEQYGTANLLSIIDATNNRYDNYDVIGGINGDYYNMVVGIPVEAYIRNFEVVSRGLGYGRPVIGFKDNGEVVIDQPCFEGMQLLIKTRWGQLKHSVPLDRVNGLPYTNLGTSVFFGDYTQAITSDLPKLVLKTIEFKTDGYQTRYFGKGTYSYQTTSEITVPSHSIVIVSNDKYVHELVEEDDVLIVQEKPACGFEDVRFALGTWEMLVDNGVAVNSMSTGTAPSSDNPRTAIGVKADGTVLLVTVDGRQAVNGMDGMSLYEVADLLVSLGAVTGYALDGGGSTTMALADGQGSYDIINSPSDGGLRSLSNAILFVTGNHDPILPPYELPDLSTQLPTPTGIYIDQDNVLRFDKVDHIEHYEIDINGTPYETNSRDLPLNLPEGTHEITIRSIGDGLYFSNSPYSEPLTFHVYKEEIQSVVELFRNLALDGTKD